MTAKNVLQYWCQKDADGDSKGLATAEVLMTRGWRAMTSELPVTIYGHCMITLNSKSSTIIGGNQNNVASAQTFMFSATDENWVDGARLKKARAYQACSIIKSR